jgi:hypothetical protein
MTRVEMLIIAPAVSECVLTAARIGLPYTRIFTVLQQTGWHFDLCAADDPYCVVQHDADHVRISARYRRHSGVKQIDAQSSTS